MKSATCVHCGLVNWVTAGACKRCGKPPQHVTGGSGGRAPQGQPPPPQPGQPPWPHAEKEREKGLAVASLVVGVVSLLTLSFFFVGGLAALVLGLAAISRARKQPHVYGGSGMAWGGVLTGALSLLMAAGLGLVLVLVVPNLLAARRAANEAMAIHTINEILVAENEYLATNPQGEYASLAQLVELGLLEPPLRRGLRDGYRFELEVTDGGCEVSAVPRAYGSSGTRSFFATCEDIRVRHADKFGLPADASDPVIYDPRGMRMYGPDASSP